MIKTYSRIISLVIFLLIFIFLVFFLVNVNSIKKEAPKVADGYIDLSKWSLASDGIVSLNGNWEFYENELFQQSNDQLTPSHYLHVPGTWGGLDGLNSINKKGYGTYRATLKLNDTENILAINIKNIRSAHAVYIDGEYVGGSGTPSTSKSTFVPGNTPYHIFFTPINEEVELVIQVSNYVFPTGGIINSVILGDAKSMVELSNIRSGVEMALILLLLFIGLYCFILFFVGKQNSSYVYIGLYMITLGLNSALTNGKIMQRLLEDMPFQHLYELQEIVQFIGCIAICFFITTFDIKLLNKRWTHIILLPIYIYLALIIIFPYDVHIIFKYFVSGYFLLIPMLIFVRLCLYYFHINKIGCLEKVSKIELMIIIGATLALLGYVLTSFMYTENLIATDMLNKIFTFSFALLMLLVMTFRFARIQEQTEKLTEQLMHANDLKDEFLLTTSHELKTPLHGIQNMVGYLLSDESKNEETVKQQLWFIRDTTMKLSLLVNDLIDVSLLKHGKIELNKSVVDLKVAVDVVLDLLAFETTGKQITMVNNVPHHTYVEVDEIRIRQVLYNLVHNAIKYTKEGVIVIHAKVNDGSVSVWVKDTGIGIAPEHFEKVFEKFEQVHRKSDITTDGGMGVGLYLSRKLVHLMRGKLRVEWSEVGKGTHIHMVLPKAINYEGFLPIHTSIITRPEQEQDINSTTLDYINGHMHTILVVDDEVTNIYSILPLLKQLSCNVLIAFSAKEALEKMENYGQVDLIILDMMMPEMSGIALCKLLREKYSILDLPIVVTTVKDSPSDITQAFRAGANDYVSKPFAGETLIARIQTLLAMKTSIHDAISNEIAFYHAQIKPHFLYNALSSVIAFCYEDGEKAAHLLTMLSKYLRHILDVDRTDLMVPLMNELELINAYIEIERARFGEQLTFKCEVSKELYGVNIPFLSIQPFIENAIRHGIFNNIDDGFIHLKIYKIADMISITIQDNGKGIEPTKLLKLQQGQKVGDSIAVSNIYKRISLMPKASIIIESKLNVGTTVTLLIPEQ